MKEDAVVGIGRCMSSGCNSGGNNDDDDADKEEGKSLYRRMANET
jgi:hypothetical protein